MQGGGVDRRASFHVHPYVMRWKAGKQTAKSSARTPSAPVTDIRPWTMHRYDIVGARLGKDAQRACRAQTCAAALDTSAGPALTALVYAALRDKTRLLDVSAGAC